MSIHFDYLLKSWVINYTHKREFLTSLLFGELHTLKGWIRHSFWLDFTFKINTVRILFEIENKLVPFRLL